MMRFGLTFLRRRPGSAGLPPVYLTVRSIVSYKLYVGGLSYSTQEEYLRQSFSPYGDIRDVKIVTDRGSGRSRGYGFVTFGSEAEAEAALRRMDGKVLDGRAIKVEHASHSSSRGVGLRGGGGFRSIRGDLGGGKGFGGNISSFEAHFFEDGDSSASVANVDDDGDAASDNEDFRNIKF